MESSTRQPVGLFFRPACAGRRAFSMHNPHRLGDRIAELVDDQSVAKARISSAPARSCHAAARPCGYGRSQFEHDCHQAVLQDWVGGLSFPVRRGQMLPPDSRPSLDADEHQVEGIWKSVDVRVGADRPGLE